MATVFSHIHFCPACSEMWRCVCWVCAEEDSDLKCKICREKDVELNPKETPNRRTSGSVESWRGAIREGKPSLGLPILFAPLSFAQCLSRIKRVEVQFIYKCPQLRTASRQQNPSHFVLYIRAIHLFPLKPHRRLSPKRPLRRRLRRPAFCWRHPVLKHFVCCLKKRTT